MSARRPTLAVASLALAGTAVAGLPAAATAQSPAAPALSSTASGTMRDGGRLVVLQGTGFTVSGALAPAVPGEVVTVAVKRGKKTISTRQVAVDANGAYAVPVQTRRSGELAIRVTHAASPALAGARAKVLKVRAAKASAGPGDRGAVVRLLQRRLSAARYATSTSGTFDAATGRAVRAWRGVAGLARTDTANASVFRGLLAGKGRFKVRHPGDGRHVEAKLGLQVVALVNGKTVERVYTTSSGKSSTPTIRGRFKVYRKDPGTNAKGMVKSSYFIRGYAIHGYASVPNFPASHGCLRVPLADASAIFGWVRLGTVVWVEN